MGALSTSPGYCKLVQFCKGPASRTSQKRVFLPPPTAITSAALSSASLGRWARRRRRGRRLRCAHVQLIPPNKKTGFLAVGTVSYGFLGRCAAGRHRFLRRGRVPTRRQSAQNGAFRPQAPPWAPSRAATATVRIKRGGKATYFFIYYEVDDDEELTALDLGDYDGDDDGSWLLLDAADVTDS